LKTFIRHLARRVGLGALDRKTGRLVPLLALLLVGGCSSLSYYGQLAEGQISLLAARRPLSQVLADPTTRPALREQLRHAEAARQFASERLGLPDNRSYRLYADIGRPYVVWNVFATEEFSLAPQTRCFPIAGCVAYRGFYSQGGTRGAAALEKQRGLDVYIGAVEAYSTLGWFDDPILSSMLHWGDERLATLIFHELAHQRYYLKDDSSFNESYASFVEQEGTRQWRLAQGLPASNGDNHRQTEQFSALVLASRERLAALYAQPLAAPAMRQAKQAEFERLRREYRELREREWGGKGRFDRWIDAPLNNAKLLPFGLYDRWVPAFATLYAQAGNDWPAFYRAVERLGSLPGEQRQAALTDLAGSAAKK
jgi:predicted aminopeptidase